MTYYLIEFRFHGKAKYEIKRLIHEINRKFRIRSKRAVPHITLAGPLYTNDEKRLIEDFNLLCSKSPIMNLAIDGFSTFDNSKVVYLDVKPSKELDEFRWNLSQKLKSYCKLNDFDYERDFSFHSTIAMKLPDDKFTAIKEYIKRNLKLNFKHVIVRATLLKGGIILREYDFFLRRPLVRSLAKDKRVYTQTLDLLKGHFENKFNPNEFTEEGIKAEDKGFIKKLGRVFGKPKTYITSDLHLEHANIIKFCKRPFLDVDEMNETLVGNWNKTIRKKDTVYYLGDLVYNYQLNQDTIKHKERFEYWIKRLNGKKIFIGGSHEPKNMEFKENFILKYSGYKFFLTHRPEDVPKDWDGWAICGHHHNNKLEEYPFIDKKNKRINISVELTKYKPVNIDELIKKIHK